jgi:serine/threonine-protein kinase
VEIGELIEDKYRIIRRIGQGGMGAVYLGENVRISRRVAIKVLHAELTKNPELTQRFEREAQAAGRIGNDHILEVLDLGKLPNGDHYIVMEYLDGEPLTARIKKGGRVSELELAGLVRQVLVGLAAAHRAGIVHRDLKPDNIFIVKEKAGKRDFCKIIDFGISKFQMQNQDSMRMTRTGMLMGTPYYMSPEQVSGRDEIDHRTDLYAVGVIMFEASTGRVPFEAASFNRLMFKIALDDVPKPEVIRPDLDPAFASLISKAMARDRDQRFQTADDFMKALDAWLARGAAVSVPSSADPAAASLIEPRPSIELTTEQKAKTGRTWATTQKDSIPVMKKSRRGLGVALGGLLVVGGAGAVVALRSSSEQPNTPPEGTVGSVSAALANPPASVAEPIVPPPTAPEPAASAVTPEPAPSAAPGPSALPKAVPLGRSRNAGQKPPATARAVEAAPVSTPPPVRPPPTPAATKARRDFGY